MKIGPHFIGICSWSLRCADYAEMIQLINQLQVTHLQLHISPLVKLSNDEVNARLSLLADAGIELTSGMCGFAGEDYSTISMIRRAGGFVPDDLWEDRRAHAQQCARLCGQMGLKMLSTHVGFVPHSNDAAYPGILKRIAQVARDFADQNVELIMETGQEKDEGLLQFLNDLNMPNVGVNFDPANMILYGAGDPVEAVHTLSRHIKHVHIKDATPSTNPGIEWGSEVPFGTGSVDHAAFLSALKSIKYTGPLTIEREAGANRLQDAQTAINTLKKLIS